MSAQPMLQADRAHEPLRLGFLGLGWIGRMRLDAIAAAAEVQIAAIADNDAGKLSAAASAYPDAHAGYDLNSLLDCDLDGVVIATPNGAHASQAVACLSRGLPVFCQKPLAITAHDVEQVIDVARSADRLLGIDFCYRHVQGMNDLRRRIQAGELGEILAIDLTFHNAYGPDKPWVYDRRLSGGGCLLDLGVHLIDLALWLQNGPALQLISSRLFARGAPVQIDQGEVEDMAFAEFRQSNDAVVRM
ncbi:MAG: Gfo/Idh/MocA family protein, partial [Steroidobacter sp.]